MLMTNKLTLPVESRMQGDLHVRFGGRLWETYHRKVVRRPSPSLHVKYAAEPLLLNVEMCDFIHDGEKVNRPNNAQEIYLKELGSESPMLVRLIMKSIHKQNKREVKHIGCKRFGIQYLLKGIYTHNGLLYFHTEIKNQSNVPFDVDYVTWKIVDKKVAQYFSYHFKCGNGRDVLSDADKRWYYPGKRKHRLFHEGGFDQYLGDRDSPVHVYGICGQCISGSSGMLPECRSDL